MSVDRASNEKGVVMLIVILLMTVLFMLTSIVFGYALREYRLNKEAGSLLQAEVQVDVAISDVIEAIIQQVDANTPIENLTVSRSGIDGKATNYYACQVYGDGFYDTDDYNATSNRKNYVVDRAIPDPLPDPLPEIVIDDIAVEILSVRDGKNVKRKLILRIRSVVAETYDVQVVEAY